MDRKPTTFETFGVLAALLTQAATLPDWHDNAFNGAEFDSDGAIRIALGSEPIAASLAALLNLTETERACEPSQFTPGKVIHRIIWKGTYVQHPIRLRAGWLASETTVEAEQ